MNETSKQSDIEEIIRRLRGGKGVSSETPLARNDYPSTQKAQAAPVTYERECSLPKEDLRVQQEMARAQAQLAQGASDRKAEIALLEKEVALLRQKEASWNTEKEMLRQEQKTLVQEEKESFATHFKFLEEKLLTLAGEKESVSKEIAELKALLAETQKTLQEKEDLLLETKTQVSNSLEALSTKEQELSVLQKEKERLVHKEEALLTQVSLLNAALTEEKNHKEIIGLSVKTNQDHIAELRSELVNLHTLLQEKEGKYLALLAEKEKAEARTREVEEHLVLRLASITELEEELTATGARVEDLEAKNSNQATEIASLTEANTAHESTITLLQEELNEYKSRVTRQNDAMAELKRRIESLDRIKTMMEEASPHVHALTDLFGPTPQSLPSLRNLVESFVVKKTVKRPSCGAEERIEQPDLF